MVKIAVDLKAGMLCIVNSADLFADSVIIGGRNISMQNIYGSYNKNNFQMHIDYEKCRSR